MQTGRPKNSRKVPKAKASKSIRLQQARAEHVLWLARYGIDGTKKPKIKSQVNSLPNLKVKSNGVDMGNQVATHGIAKCINRYTGDELMGIGLVHKSGYAPIRKDNPQSAKDLANMRRST